MVSNYFKYFSKTFLAMRSCSLSLYFEILLWTFLCLCLVRICKNYSVCVYRKFSHRHGTIFCLPSSNECLLPTRSSPNESTANECSYCFQPLSCEQLLVNFAVLFVLSVTWDKPVLLSEMLFISVSTQVLLVFQESVQMCLLPLSKMRHLSFCLLIKVHIWILSTFCCLYT